MIKITSRLQKIRCKLNENEIDAFLVSQPENRYYLSGFDGSAGFLLITQEESILATDFRYTEQAKGQAPDYEILQIKGEIAEWLPGLVTDLKLKSLGFEAGNLTFALYQKISEALNKTQPHFKLMSLNGLVESLRAIKEAGEIELIKKAVKIADAALGYIEEIIHAGMIEKDLAWEVEKFLRENGSDGMPFDIIVASGPNAALPHAKPSAHAINAGEPVIVDLGARVGAYTSDMTRTFCVGRRDKTFDKIYKIVLDAQQEAMDKMKFEMTGGEVDSLARKVIEQAGYGEAFGHGLGHGVGLATHEQPRLGPGSTDKIVNGIVFTVEPGIYLSGWGGVRIEDVALMENDKISVISKARK